MKADTLVLSDPGKIMSHPAMRAIIAMGEEVVSLILRDLQDKPSLLVWALPEITGKNLAPPRTEVSFLKWSVETQIEAWLGGDGKRALYERVPLVVAGRKRPRCRLARLGGSGGNAQRFHGRLLDDWLRRRW